MALFRLNRAAKMAPLLFGSGLCALIYQVVWQRQFRLVFGASTAATAAVMAIFVGAMGIGSLVLGPRADRQRQPLRMYAALEFGITISAALTPMLLWLAQGIYLATGGSAAMGLGWATVLRLALSALVLAVPTFFMGGTLPAVARGVESDNDSGRGRFALVYGANTLGAVAGCLLATFFMLENLGSRASLWATCGANLVIAIIAWCTGGDVRSAVAAKGQFVETRDGAPKKKVKRENETVAAEAPQVLAAFTPIAAMIVGFVFFLMEMVWYRMLTPILAGTVYTFGLILAMALVGIGLGSAAYGNRERKRRVTLNEFAYTCLAEAVAVAIPFALGDRVAIWALQLRGLRTVMPQGMIVGWTVIAALVVFPAAFVAGWQFPVLIGLMGSGRDRVGSQVGRVYASNTAGAIAGSLAGGFGFLPLLGATGCWQLGAGLLTSLGMFAALFAFRENRSKKPLVGSMAMAGAAVILLNTLGPTAAWRHSQIGVRHKDLPDLSTNGVEDFKRRWRRAIKWEADGLESSIALNQADGYSFYVNGKNDSNVRGDAATTIMSGVLGAILNPQARYAMIIGLGTGSTAGWLASLPGISRVDVIELEAAVLRVARDCAAGNLDALSNPKVRVTIGDAREALLTSRRNYDLIMSEPSNPYRAGVASLFTREYYEAASHRLSPGGLFLQWVESYDIDLKTMGCIYKTIHTVFPHIQTWTLGPGDMMMVASMTPLKLDADALRHQLSVPEVKRAVLSAWNVDDIEGVLAHYVAGLEKSLKTATTPGTEVNTDDRTVVEFMCARTLGSAGLEPEGLLQYFGNGLVGERPSVAGGPVDWGRVEDYKSLVFSSEALEPAQDPLLRRGQLLRSEAQKKFIDEDYPAMLRLWSEQDAPPRSWLELSMVGIGLADAGSSRALEITEKLRTFSPSEADMILGILHLRQDNLDEATADFGRAFEGLRHDPWAWDATCFVGINRAYDLGSTNAKYARAIFEQLKEPFSLHILNQYRLNVLMHLSPLLDPGRAAGEIWRPMEPNVPWKEDILKFRADAYRDAADPLAPQALAELLKFQRNSNR